MPRSLGAREVAFAHAFAHELLALVSLQPLSLGLVVARLALERRRCRRLGGIGRGDLIGPAPEAGAHEGAPLVALEAFLLGLRIAVLHAEVLGCQRLS